MRLAHEVCHPATAPDLTGSRQRDAQGGIGDPLDRLHIAHDFKTKVSAGTRHSIHLGGDRLVLRPSPIDSSWTQAECQKNKVRRNLSSDPGRGARMYCSLFPNI